MNISNPKIGELVALKSGGQVMKIQGVGYTPKGSYKLTCAWFTKDERLNEGAFRGEVIERVTK